MAACAVILPSDLLLGGSPPPILALDLEHRQSTIGIMQKRGPRVAHVNGCNAYGRLLFLMEETTAGGENFVGRACVSGVGVTLQERGCALH